MSESNQRIVLASTPEAMPGPEHFALETVALPAADTGEVLCRTRYLSLDPYMRSQIAGRHISGAIAPGDVLRGETVSEVVEDASGTYAPGQLVRCMGGWQEYSRHGVDALAALPDDLARPSLALSLLGMTGLTAWAGMVWQAGVKAGDVVLVPAVTGAVGSAAAQFCRARGARVIGVAGSGEKCRFAREQLGVSECINRRTEDFPARLAELAPGGVDIYFDLIGGDMLQTACEQLANYGRVVLCGLMAEYNSAGRRPGPPPGLLILKRAVVSGLVVYDYEPRRSEFIDACLPLLRGGDIDQREDVTEGIENAPAAFCRLMRGENFGKVVIKV